MSSTVNLFALLAPWSGLDSTLDRPVEGLTLDSRRVQPSWLFLAVAGSSRHGLAHLDEALARGATAVAWEPAPGFDPHAVQDRCRAVGAVAVPVEGLAKTAGEIAARYHAHPSSALRVIGVTGTDGKTSVAHYAAQLADWLDGSSAIMGTLGWGDVTAPVEPGLTTADAVSVQTRLAELRNRHVRTVAMEVSSHALVQSRVEAVEFNVAVLTQVGRDHLDYHGTMEAYQAAKRRLFTHAGLGECVLNRDDGLGAELLSAPDRTAPAISYGRHPDADLRIVGTAPQATGLRLDALFRGVERTLVLPLLGEFNALNALAALGAFVAHYPLDEALEGLARIRPVPGRMEYYRTPTDALAVIDYAHTPGALEAALGALRRHLAGRLICVMGCGGDRDPGKRKLMGAAATGLADTVIVTDDNPRSENPAKIRAEVRAGCHPGRDCREIADREEAIAVAIAMAGPGDGVLVAGKGHETEQIVGQTSHPFSDRAVVKSRAQGGMS